MSAPKFAEAFGESGVVDLLEAMRLFGAAGYGGPLVYEQVPTKVGDSTRHDQAVAFDMGYMKALMAAADAE